MLNLNDLRIELLQSEARCRSQLEDPAVIGTRDLLFVSCPPEPVTLTP